MINKIISRIKQLDRILDKVELVKRVFSRLSKMVVDLISLFLASELVRRIMRDGGNGGNSGGGITVTSNEVNSVVNNSGGVNDVLTNGMVNNGNMIYGSNVNNPAIYGYYPNVVPMDSGSYYFNVYYRADSMYDFIVLILGMVMIFVIVLRIISLFTRRKTGRSRRTRR